MAFKAESKLSLLTSFKNFLVRYFCPDAYVESVTDIDLDLLRKKGYRAFIFDLDNTLLGWRSKEISEKTALWLKEAEKFGYKVCIVSNSFKKRVTRFSKSLGIPSISKAIKPRKKVFLEALKTLGSKPAETVVVGDQLFTDVLGGKRMNFFTILVYPVDKHELFITILVRIPEKIILAFFRKRGLLKKLS